MNLRFGITGKLLVWFLVIIAIFYGTILVLYINVQQVVKLSGSIVAKNYAIASGTKKMMETLLSMEENKQKFLLLKKADYLVFFNEAQRAFEENLDQVTRLTAMGHDISDVWRDISHDYDTYPNAAEVYAYLSGKVKDPEAVKMEPMKSWGLTFTFRALRSRNYRLFFAGQGISLIGTWMQQVAMIWLVYRLTHSAFLLGVVGFAGQIPTFLLAPFTGVLADRWNRHRTIVVTQTLALLQAATLAILVLTETAQVWHLIALAVILGTINALDMPVRQSFIIQMIERKEDLANAIALNSAMVTATRLLGPSIAGILIGAFGEGICFLVNAISYVAVIAALLAMRVEPPPARPADGRMIDGLKEGFAYVVGFAPVRDILLLLAFVSLMGMPYYILMPVFAKDVLGGGAHTLGFLMGASGFGALVGTIYLATRKSIRGFGRIISVAATVFGAGLIAFSLSHVVWLSMILVFVAGLGMMAQMACSNTIIQTIVDNDKRGRVMSLFTMAFIGMAPFGSLFAGALASRIGAPNTLAIGGGFCVAGGIVFASRLKAMREVLHPIYRKMGIMPDIGS